jgi:hypothetical protein
VQARITSNPSRQYGSQRWHESQLSAPSPPYLCCWTRAGSGHLVVAELFCTRPDGCPITDRRVSVVSDRPLGPLAQVLRRPPTDRNTSTQPWQGTSLRFASHCYCHHRTGPVPVTPRNPRPLASLAPLYRYAFAPTLKY